MLLSILLVLLNLENSVVSNESFLGLLALLIQDSKVVPHLVELRLQGSSFDDVVEGLLVLSFLIVVIGERCPKDSFIWSFVSSLMEVVVGFTMLAQLKHASTIDVQSIGASFQLTFSFIEVFERSLNVTFEEVAPCEVLVDSVIMLVQ
jgi:hypothetical protein